MPGEPLDCGTQAPGEWAVAQGFALLAAMYSAGRGCSLGTLGLSQLAGRKKGRERTWPLPLRASSVAESYGHSYLQGRLTDVL